MSQRPTPVEPGLPSAGRRPRRQQGMTLIEVMVALLVFSAGLLGLVTLQARATQYSIGAEDANRAALLANDIATTMWAQRSVTVPQVVLETWSARVADTAGGGLPNGTGTVAVAAGVATVTVTWRPVGALDDAVHRYQTQVVIP